MITKFKIFESVSVKPKVGDYAIVELIENKKFNAIGIITNITSLLTYPYTIEFDGLDMYNQSGKFVDVYNLDELKYWSDSKEELEQLLLNNKFNI